MRGLLEGGILSDTAALKAEVAGCASCDQRSRDETKTIVDANNVDCLARRADRSGPSSEQESAPGQNLLAGVLRSLSGIPSRREVLRGLVATGFGLGLAVFPQLSEAKPKRRKKKRKRPTPAKPNQYGCLEVNDPCRQHTQCCSGVCTGQPGKKRCRAHNTGGCTAQFDGCSGLLVGCGTQGYCVRTTGKASFCGGAPADCAVCRRDADCEATYGAGAACVACANCIEQAGIGTACFPAAA
jgi:hypothetical protein